MNLHPIFVHFPIALFTLYSCIEFLRFRKIRESMTWHTVKLVLLSAGFLGALAAIQTGPVTAELRGNELYQTHKLFANISAWIFGFILFIYLVVVFGEKVVRWAIMKYGDGSSVDRFLNGIYMTAKFIQGSSILMYILALSGLLCITVTGALGGTMVYGPNVEPVAAFINKLLF